MTLSKYLQNQAHTLGRNLRSSNKQKTLEKITTLILSNSKAHRTQTSNFSHVKKIMRRYTNDLVFLNKIKPPLFITQKVIKMDNAVLDTRTSFTVSRKAIEQMINYRHSSDIFELAIYLLLVSGRRVKEITDSKITDCAKRASLPSVGERNRLCIDNIVKRKDKNQNLKFLILRDKQEFMRSYRKFKKLYTTQNKRTFHTLLIRRIKKWFGHSYHPHLLRKIYAVYHFKFRNPRNLTINPFIKQLLLQQNIRSSVFYTGIKFDFRRDIL